MNASELEELTSQLEFSKRCRWQTNRSYCSPVIREEDVDHIIKSLRFAADMEKIYEHCGEIVIRKRKKPQWEIQYLSGRVAESEGDSIYTAARNAVEQLEGKSQ